MALLYKIAKQFFITISVHMQAAGMMINKFYSGRFA